jgi:SAM-dependent methyltransferase
VPSLLTTARRMYHTLVPSSVRRLPIFDRLSYWFVLRLASHNELYCESYYDDVEQLVATSAPTLAESITRAFTAKRVVDVGCGTGALLEALRKRGCFCFGLEYSNAALKVCRSRGLDVRAFDLERDCLEQKVGTFDVAVSTEVAEHLPKKCADRFVELLASLSPNIILTAAPPGQGGVDHVNEQPNEYWIDKFAVRGFQFDRKLTDDFRREWKEKKVASFYHKNVMVFHQTARQDVASQFSEP